MFAIVQLFAVVLLQDKGVKMLMNQIQNSPWVSILPEEEFDKLNRNQMLALISMLAQVTLQAIESYQTGMYGTIDALIGNWGCETHAFNILSLSHSNELRDECNGMRSACARIMDWVSNNPFPLNEIYTRVKQMYEISHEMSYLIQSRILTISKVSILNEAKFGTSLYETQKTVPSELMRAFGLKEHGVKYPVLHPILSIMQSKMSEISIIYMTLKLNQLGTVDQHNGEVVKRMSRDSAHKHGTYFPKTYSCCYYNAKALLLLIAELRTPLVIKRVSRPGEPKILFLFKPKLEFGQFEVMSEDEIRSDTPLIVCASFLSESMPLEVWLRKVLRYGLGNMILSYSAQGDQFVPENENYIVTDQEALVEMAAQKEKAERIECVLNRGIISLDHFYCSTWRELNEQN